VPLKGTQQLQNSFKDTVSRG